MGKGFTQEEFLKKAKEIHGELYSYEKTDLKNKIEKGRVCITCPTHGDFYKNVSEHINNKQGCPICSKELKEKEQMEHFYEMIERAKTIHDNKYDYSKIEFKPVKEKNYIICPIHGEFLQSIDNHVNFSQGCPKCCGKNKTTKEWIEEVKTKHTIEYDYSKVEYINNNTKVCIICPIHGEFFQKPCVHLRGNGCPKCGIDSNAQKLTLTLEYFLERAKIVHGDKYDYSKVKYEKMNIPVTITCPIHGDFLQTPQGHLTRRGCSLCVGRGKTTLDIVNNFKKKYGDKFDYSEVLKINKIGNKDKLPIICHKKNKNGTEHGIFYQNYNQHLAYKHGCPKCAKEDSNYYENMLHDFIEKEIKNVEILKNYRPDFLKTIDTKKNQELDIFIPKYNIAIEYQGRQHFVNIFNDEKAFDRLRELDEIKFNKCKELGVKLFYFTKDERNIPNIYFDKIFINEEELIEEIKREIP